MNRSLTRFVRTKSTSSLILPCIRQETACWFSRVSQRNSKVPRLPIPAARVWKQSTIDSPIRISIRRKAQEELYSEKSIRLPDSFWCYHPLHDGSSPLPAVKNGYVTFGCLNNFCKITQPTLDLWRSVLTTTPNSRFIMLAPPGSARTRVLETLDLPADRIEIFDRQPRDKYFELYNRIDIGLDTIPYNGHTTSLDSLWMGVPVVTLVGKTVVGRAGWCQLRNLGLENLAAQSPDEFVRIASRLAADMNKLADLRAGLRKRMQESSLMDGPKFAAGIESAYRAMWRTWCEAPGPKSV